MDIALEAGAEDVRDEGDTLQIIFPPEQLDQIKKKVEEAGYTPQLIDFTMIPQTTVPLKGKEAYQMLNLMNALDESDEVQKIYANFDIPDEIIEEVSSK